MILVNKIMKILDFGHQKILRPLKICTHTLTDTYTVHTLLLSSSQLYGLIISTII